MGRLSHTCVIVNLTLAEQMAGRAPCEACERARCNSEWLSRLLGPIRAAAKWKGYSIAVHGSLERDIDLVAVPWVETAASQVRLFEAVFAAVSRIASNAYIRNDPDADPNDYTRRSPEPKPHGRLAWSIYLGDGRSYVDLSVMPPRRKEDDRGEG